MNITEFYNRYWELISYREEYSHPKCVLKVYADAKKNEVLEKIVSVINMSEDSRVLDIGGGNRKLFDLLKQEGYKGKYYSFDIAGENHDFDNLSEIKGLYDTIFMMELLEHLELDKSLEYLSKAFNILKNDGYLIVSTPNIDHINQLWKQDITHIRQYPAKDVYSILRMVGFHKDISVFRVYLTNRGKSIKKKIKERMQIMLTKVLDVDFAHGILVIAKK